MLNPNWNMNDIQEIKGKFKKKLLLKLAEYSVYIVKATVDKTDSYEATEKLIKKRDAVVSLVEKEMITYGNKREAEGREKETSELVKFCPELRPILDKALLLRQQARSLNKDE